MLPNNPVTPTSKQYHQDLSIRGKVEPTPPPEVLAMTKFLYEARGTGNEARIKMWVTSVHRAGPSLVCVGWLVRYPQPVRDGFMHAPGSAGGGSANGTQIRIGGGGAPSGTYSGLDAALAPIVEVNASTDCSQRYLVPFGSSPAPSP